MRHASAPCPPPRQLGRSRVQHVNNAQFALVSEILAKSLKIREDNDAEVDHDEVLQRPGALWVQWWRTVVELNPAWGAAYRSAVLAPRDVGTAPADDQGLAAWRHCANSIRAAGAPLHTILLQCEQSDRSVVTVTS